MKTVPTIVIGGTGSGVGKTSITVGLCRALRNAGKCVQPFKVGPDFLDPSYLTRAAGRTCYNLDAWMTDPDYVRTVFQRASADADIAVVEGVMGLFDGAYADKLQGSTAEMAAILGAPVLLIANSHGMARSIAPLVQGFAGFHPDVTVGGVIANHVSSDGHVYYLRDALETSGLPQLMGAVKRNSLSGLETRHLGLLTASEENVGEDVFAALGNTLAEALDLNRIEQLASSAIEQRNTRIESVLRTKNVRIGIARDASFQFYYPDNLEMLEEAGAELVPFSPLHDSQLPEQLNGLYFGGGYPEVHASELASNESFLNSVRQAAQSDMPIYAECGGLMYLGQSIRSSDNDEVFNMSGVLPIRTEMLTRLKRLGYCEVEFLHDTCLAKKGNRARGHEFHYSAIIEDESASADWQPSYCASFRRGKKVEQRGFCKGKILASYIHLHFGSGVGFDWLVGETNNS